MSDYTNKDSQNKIIPYLYANYLSKIPKKTTFSYFDEFLTFIKYLSKKLNDEYTANKTLSESNKYTDEVYSFHEKLTDIRDKRNQEYGNGNYGDDDFKRHVYFITNKKCARPFRKGEEKKCIIQSNILNKNNLNSDTEPTDIKQYFDTLVNNSATNDDHEKYIKQRDFIQELAYLGTLEHNIEILFDDDYITTNDTNLKQILESLKSKETKEPFKTILTPNFFDMIKRIPIPSNSPHIIENAALLTLIVNNEECKTLIYVYNILQKTSFKSGTEKQTPITFEELGYYKILGEINLGDKNAFKGTMISLLENNKSIQELPEHNPLDIAKTIYNQLYETNMSQNAEAIPPTSPPKTMYTLNAIKDGELKPKNTGSDTDSDTDSDTGSETGFDTDNASEKSSDSGAQYIFTTPVRHGQPEILDTIENVPDQFKISDEERILFIANTGLQLLERPVTPRSIQSGSQGGGFLLKSRDSSSKPVSKSKSKSQSQSSSSSSSTDLTRYLYVKWILSKMNVHTTMYTIKLSKLFFYRYLITNFGSFKYVDVALEVFYNTVLYYILFTFNKSDEIFMSYLVDFLVVTGCLVLYLRYIENQNEMAIREAFQESVRAEGELDKLKKSGELDESLEKKLQLKPMNPEVIHIDLGIVQAICMTPFYAIMLDV